MKKFNKKSFNKDKTTTTNGGFNNTSYVNSKNSPNLSVSEWVTNNVEKYNDEKMSQCDITFEGKLSNVIILILIVLIFIFFIFIFFSYDLDM